MPRDSAVPAYGGAPLSGSMQDFRHRVFQNGERTCRTIYGRYMRLGDLVVVNGDVVIEQAGSAGNPIMFTLPVPPAIVTGGTAAAGTRQNRILCLGSFVYIRTGVTLWSGAVCSPNEPGGPGFPLQPERLFVAALQAGAPLADFVGTTSSGNFATANGDELSFSLTYFARDGY